MKLKIGKKTIIAVIVVLAMAVFAVLLNFTVDKMFSKVTEKIGEHGLLSGETQEETEEDSKFNPEELKNIESEISSKDKMAVLILLAKALPAKEYSRLMSFVEGGITDGEVEQAYQILKKYLTPEQKKQIKDYYFKYLYLVQD